ncbi:MAG: hypothetical protein AB7O32_15460 [Vicinamibacterales bacterium]
MRHYIRILSIVALAAGATACDEDLSSLTGPTPNLEPTFSSIQANILETSDSSNRVACTNCHTNVGRVPAGNLNLLRDVAYDQLVNRMSGQRTNLALVQPGDPENSYLVHKLDGRPGIVNLRMPRNSPAFLTDGQILVIRRWIELGARRD